MNHEHAFFYEGAARREAVDALFEGIHRPDPVVLVIGGPGCGRTTVLERFAAEADPEVLVVARVTGDILMSDRQCFDALAAMLGAPAAARDARDALLSAIDRVRAEGRSPVLVVDDAHELGEDAREAVVGIGEETRVALVLAGDETLSGLATRTRATVVALLPFSEDETEDFIAAWLAVGDEDELPSHRTVTRLYRQSGGMPGRLVALLQGGAAARTPLLPAGFPLWHVVFTVGAVVVLAWLLLRNGGQEPVAVAAEPEEIVVPLPQPAGVASTRSVVVPGDAVVSTPAPVVDVGAPGAVTVPAAPSPAVSRFSADEQSLLREPSGRYTLQLFASFNEEAVRQFRAKHPALGIRLFRTLREDLPWHVAVTGVFRSKDEAKAAIPRFPADVQGLKPWARSLQGIQDELRRRKD